MAKNSTINKNFSLIILFMTGYWENKMAPQAGLEPATQRLTVVCSTNWATGENQQFK